MGEDEYICDSYGHECEQLKNQQERSAVASNDWVMRTAYICQGITKLWINKLKALCSRKRKDT